MAEFTPNATPFIPSEPRNIPHQDSVVFATQNGARAQNANVGSHNQQMVHQHQIQQMQQQNMEQASEFTAGKSMVQQESLKAEVIGDDVTTDKNGLYKTELCRKWAQTGFCRYGDKCQFAHGLHELRSTVKHPLYKTTPCKSFQSTGTCRYGNRCRFIHDESEFELAQVPRGVPAQNLSVETNGGRTTILMSSSYSSPSLQPVSVSSIPRVPSLPTTTHLAANASIPRVPSAPANINQTFSEQQIGGYMHTPHMHAVSSPGLHAYAPHQIQQNEHNAFSVAHMAASLPQVQSTPVQYEHNMGTNSTLLSDQVLPNFCLPMAPKVGFTSSQRNMTSSENNASATAKAFGKSTLDLNKSTFSREGFEQDTMSCLEFNEHVGSMWGSDSVPQTTTVSSTSSVTSSSSSASFAADFGNAIAANTNPRAPQEYENGSILGDLRSSSHLVLKDPTQVTVTGAITSPEKQIVGPGRNSPKAHGNENGSHQFLRTIVDPALSRSIFSTNHLDVY